MTFRTLAAFLLLAPLLAAAQSPIGEVALVTGSVTASVAGAAPTPLKAGDALAEGQTITVAANSYASLKFADGGRVLLRPNSEFLVESFKYVPAPVDSAPAPAAPAGAVGSAFFRLARGGFRAISGLIGKADRQSYKVTTPVATIGIRGTDYEVQLCSGDCPTQPQAGAAPPPAEGGVIVATHEGSIEVRPPTGGAVLQVDAGQVGVMMASGQTFMLPLVPDALIRDPAPDPETCE